MPAQQISSQVGPQRTLYAPVQQDVQVFIPYTYPQMPKELLLAHMGMVVSIA